MVCFLSSNKKPKWRYKTCTERNYKGFLSFLFVIKNGFQTKLEACPTTKLRLKQYIKNSRWSQEQAEDVHELF